MQIFLNGQELDLAVGEKVALTFQTNDLGDVSKANTSYTNSFKIPLTAKNRKIFEFLGVQGSTTRLPYEQVRVDVYENSLPIVTGGYCYINQVTSKDITINIYGAEKTFFETIKTLSLQEVYPSTEIVWQASTLINYVNSTENFVFPASQYNAYTTLSGYLWTLTPYITTPAVYTTPHFYVKYIFERIFEHLGYEVDYPIADDEVFKRLLIPAKKGVSHFPVIPYVAFDIKQCLFDDVYCDVFLKEIMVRWGLVIRVDEFNKKVFFVRMDDLLSNSEVVDWSDKYDSLSNRKYTIGGYAQKNKFTVSDDTADEHWPNIFQANYLLGSFEIDNEQLAAETTVFASSLPKPRYWGESTTDGGTTFKGRLFTDYYVLGYYLFDLAENEMDEDGQIEIKELPFQFLYLAEKLSTDLISYIFSDPSGFSSSISAPARVATYDYLGWQYYLDNHYFYLKQLFDNMELIKVKMKLSVLDIYNLDLFKRVYLEQYGSYFFINKISNWQKDKLVEVELIKIPPLEEA